MHARPLSPCRSPPAHPDQPSSTSRRRRSTNTLNHGGPSLSLDTGRDCLGGLGIALQHRDAWVGAGEAHEQHHAGAAARRRGGASGGSAASLHGCASDSAYGTLDELDSSRAVDDDEEDEAVEDAVSWASERGPAWRDRVEASLTERSRRRVQSAVAADGWQLRDGVRGGEAGDGLYWRRTLGAPSSQANTAQSSPDVAHEPVFSFDLAYDADSSFDSLHSLCSPFATRPSAPASGCSSRSSPEPSEYGESDSAATRLTMASRRRTAAFLGGETAEELTTSFLARRHTLPRRHKAREVGRKPSHSSLRKSSRSSLTVSESDAAALALTPPSSTTWPALPLLSTIVLLATCIVSAASLISPVALVVPISPVPLRHAASPHEIVTELANAALAPILVQPSLPSLALAAINFYLVQHLDTSTCSTSRRAKGALAAALWAAIVGLRVLASWVFGRVLGWAHPQFLSTRAIHEVGSGLAPLLLALSLVHLATSRRSDTFASSSCALLGASFLVPVERGGAGLWLGACAVVVGVVAALAITIWRTFTASPSTRSTSSPVALGSPTPSASRTWTSTFLALVLVPSLALYPSASHTTSPTATDLAFSRLHPADSTLVTVLLMTAPRPGDPDFLVQTIESWLGAFPDLDSSSSALVSNTSYLPTSPEPSLLAPTSSRLRLVVYTHFAAHLMFDLARQHFASSAKAAHYISWRRDPHALAQGAHDRLDQRLHVARGLEHAAGLGGTYVLLTEDDFPLCEDERAVGDEGARSWTGAWAKLQAALVATNELMPDAPVLDGGVATEASMGHCGLFLATGGSGLAIRTPLAARLPALLLGADDPHGNEREAAAARGEIELRREGDGADTPDLVIQDCLRGRLPECAVCAPGGGPSVVAASASGRSARRPNRWDGERRGKSGLAGTERLLQRHLGYNASTLPGRQYGREEWACGWRQPFNGEPDVLTV
ncbi:hypothetical protein JCM8208_002762 [Rhodotorula glutinis]